MSNIENNSGLHTQSPSLLLAQVEVEVNTELSNSSVAVVGMVVTSSIGIEVVHVTGTQTRADLKQTGSTLVATNPVHQVHLSHQTSSHVIYCAVRVVHVPVAPVVESSLNLSLQREHGSDALCQLQTSDTTVRSVKVVQVGCNTTIDTD